MDPFLVARDVFQESLGGRGVAAVVYVLGWRVADLVPNVIDPFEVVRCVKPVTERFHRREDQRLEFVPLQVRDETPVADIFRQGGLQCLTSLCRVRVVAVFLEARKVIREAVEIEERSEPEVWAVVASQDALDVPAPIREVCPPPWSSAPRSEGLASARSSLRRLLPALTLPTFVAGEGDSAKLPRCGRSTPFTNSTSVSPSTTNIRRVTGAPR